jgi:cystathionine beta-synthase
MKYYNNVLELIGNTPLVKINNGCHTGQGPLMLGKIEYQNPGGSVKDRMAYYVIKKALKEGHLKPGGTVIDNTSGNAGIALALVASVLGVKAVLTTPEKTSQEKVDQIRAFGATVIRTPSDLPHDDPEGAYMKAIILAREHGYFHMNQYHSLDNIEAHYVTTGPEIWEQTEGRITHLVAGIGTGGTLSGAAKYLKEKKPSLKAIAVDPEGSVFAEYYRSGKEIEGRPYKMEGIGSDVMTKALLVEMIDELITVSDEIAFNTARQMALKEGLMVGGSSGAAVWAARQIAPKLNAKDLVIVIIPDPGTKYLTKCFNDGWMIQNGFSVNTASPARVEVK